MITESCTGRRAQLSRLLSFGKWALRNASAVCVCVRQKKVKTKHIQCCCCCCSWHLLHGHNLGRLSDLRARICCQLNVYTKLKLYIFCGCLNWKGENQNDEHTNGIGRAISEASPSHRSLNVYRPRQATQSNQGINIAHIRKGWIEFGIGHWSDWMRKNDRE